MKTIAILLCAGAGNRMGESVAGKVLVQLDNRPIFDHSLRAFEAHPHTDGYLIVYRNWAQKKQLERRILKMTGRPMIWIEGGDERQESVFNALQALPRDTEYVFIHDCVRPLIRPGQLEKLYRAVVEDKAACLAHRMVNTVKQVAPGSTGTRKLQLINLDRNTLWAMETPQVFSAALIRDCYHKAKKDGIPITDDSATVIHYGHKVTLVENPHSNPKITFPEDLSLAQFLLEKDHTHTG